MYNILVLSMLLASAFFLPLLSVNSAKEIGLSHNSSYATDSDLQLTTSTDNGAYMKPTEEELREELTPLQYGEHA